ncbi:MAG: hypothetical protein ACLU9Q_18995 [Marvinbryantia sp.]|uniref:hypothetical protein n=2 Tax=Marvinbryantia sp. TaxID=2496532 RepID=UPI0025E2E416|nr:hypothetical protein [uncultured Marvinbryantia sp.]
MRGDFIITERQIENGIKKLQVIEAQQKVLEEQAEALKAALPEIYNQYCKVSTSLRFKPPFYSSIKNALVRGRNSGMGDTYKTIASAAGIFIFT